MIKSMTGFAALTREDDRVALNVTLRAVNHRFLDVQTRMPPSLGDQEARIRALVQQVIARGRIDVSVGMQSKRVVVPSLKVTVTAQREAGNVLVGKVVPDLAEQRQQRVLAAGAEDVLGARIAQRVLDVSGIGRL